jgi:predicted DNA-binding transcriptional regulator YafY
MIYIDITPEDYMPIQKKQIERLIKFTAQMKLGKYPNAKTFCDELKNIDTVRDLGDIPYEKISCSLKTIHRDIRLLRERYNAPIEFDPQRNGYYLTRNTWELNFPVLQDEVMLASVLGSKLAQDLMPEPLKSEISDAVAQELTTNAPDFLDVAFIDSLVAASGVKVHINPYIFKHIFDAWQNHEAVDIEYKSSNGEVSERRIEPHVMTYYNSAWYIKGFCLKQNDVRVFAIHRIQNVEHTGKFFEPDPLIIQSAKNRHIFSYETIKNIEIECSKSIAGYINEQHEFYNEDIVTHDDGSVTVHIPEAPEHEIIKWVLSEAGNAKVIKPAKLAKKIVKAAEKVAEINCS